MSGMKNTIKAALLLLGMLLGMPALAQQVQPALPAGILAYPSLWHIKGDPAKGDLGEVYLLGSVHVLPPRVHWRSPPINRALSRSDIYVFEVPQDDAAMAELNGLVQEKGFLPPGETLRGQLHPKALADYDAAVAASGLPPASLERERPWLAALQMMFAQISKLDFAPGNGVDAVLMKDAAQEHKPMRYLETVADQFAVLAPDDRALELEEFESSLKDLRDMAAEFEPMVRAWSTGNQAKLDALINGDLDEYPEARKLLLDDRNKRWAPQIQAMLKEKHIFFVTVGAGHLTGRNGLPALLRRAGYKVDGP
ncbi:MAG: TraB/GumN family protein [Rhizomicrobium sp.]